MEEEGEKVGGGGEAVGVEKVGAGNNPRGNTEMKEGRICQKKEDPVRLVDDDLQHVY